MHKNKSKAPLNGKQSLDLGNTDTPSSPSLPSSSQNMEESNFEIPLDEMFSTRTTVKDKDDVVELSANEELEPLKRLIALVVKPHGFKTPPIKVVASHLQSAWQFTKGVTIMPNKYVKNTLICIFLRPH